jgi:hypothetical protein
MAEIKKVVKNRRTNLRKNGYPGVNFPEDPAAEPVNSHPGCNSRSRYRPSQSSEAAGLRAGRAGLLKRPLSVRMASPYG